jgi:hypothetical protein
MRWYAGPVVFDPAAIAADAVALAELPGGTGQERVRIDWLQRRLTRAPGSRHVDDVGNLVWTFGGAPYRLEDMHALTERIRADSILTGAKQLRAVLAEVLKPC